LSQQNRPLLERKACEYCRGHGGLLPRCSCDAGEDEGESGSPQEKTRRNSATPSKASAHHPGTTTAGFGTYFGRRIRDRNERRKHRIHRYFTLRYHVNLIAQNAPKLLSLLFHGTPRWLFKLIRLLTFVVALLPGFVVFAYYYFWSADRIALPYKEEGGSDTDNGGGGPRTSRHFADVYGSRTVWTRHNDGRGSSYDRQDSSTSTAIATGDEQAGGDCRYSKPVVIFLTGGAFIIGYKMWGALLARVLVPHGVLVVIPDYRNFPQANVGEMVGDVDAAIQWTLDNCATYGGDPKRVVVVGQSAGAHLGSCVLLRKGLDELNEATKEAPPSFPQESNPLRTQYKARDIRGFMAASGPYNIMAMQDIFHRHGLDRNIVSLMFGNNLDRHSPTHLVEQCRRLCDRTDGSLSLSLDYVLPPFYIVHGTADKTVPYCGAEEYSSCLRDAGVRVTSKNYVGWSHTDPIIERPMNGVHTFHRDVYDFVRQWASVGAGTSSKGLPSNSEKANEGEGDHDTPTMMMPFDDSLPVCRPICWSLLVSVGRFCNPF
jgi:prenylcysteine alpha-carboxyl methylesterase